MLFKNIDIQNVNLIIKLRQWRKDVISLNYQLYRDRYDEEDANVTKLLWLNGVKSNSSNEVSITNSDVLERLYNVTIPEEVEIFVPYVQHNKGCRKKRLICEFENQL
uniref:Uncharacterized protein n=1 Tax=Lactuca sativa TaxID=4236 RepID=A0A9R1X494_LACSA|nr:hypothetical protein LSAT_V11C700355920 [Lactuca sativa]